MTRWKRFLTVTAFTLGVGVIALPASNAAAIDILSKGCEGNGGSTVCQSKDDEAVPLIRIVVNTALFVLGMVAVIMIIVGGIRYATSGGDASAIKGAKDTILYSVIGLIVAIMAYAIVEFVTRQMK